jgi:hypothetical protein
MFGSACQEKNTRSRGRPDTWHGRLWLSVRIFVVVAHPGHWISQGAFVAALRNEIEDRVNAKQVFETAPVCRVGMEDFAVGILVEGAETGSFLTRERARIEVVYFALAQLVTW